MEEGSRSEFAQEQHLSTCPTETFKVPVHIEEKVRELWKAPGIDDWLTDHLSKSHKEMYIQILQARYSTVEKFPINFDDLVKYLGYTKKHHPTDHLKSQFTEGEDWILLPKNGGRAEQSSETQVLFPGPGEKSGRGRPTDQYRLTRTCAEMFALWAGTEKGKQVREFFVTILDVIQDYHVLSLQIANKLAVHQARHDALMKQYGHGKHVWYRFWVGKQGGKWELQKPGKTNRLAKRHAETVAIYGMAYLADVIETHYNQELEAAVKADPLVIRYRISLVVKGENQTELVQIRDDLTDEQFSKIGRIHLKKFIEDGQDERHHKEKMLQLEIDKVQVEMQNKRDLLRDLVSAGFKGKELKEMLTLMMPPTQSFPTAPSAPLPTQPTMELDPVNLATDGVDAVESCTSSEPSLSDLLTRFVKERLKNVPGGLLPWMSFMEAFPQPRHLAVDKTTLQGMLKRHGLDFKDTHVYGKKFRGYFGWEIIPVTPATDFYVGQNIAHKSH